LDRRGLLGGGRARDYGSDLAGVWVDNAGLSDEPEAKVA